MVITIIFWIFFSMMIGNWARKWNRNGYIWYFIAFFFSPLLAAVFLYGSGSAMPKCPHCLGEVVLGAVACKNCGRDL